MLAEKLGGLFWISWFYFFCSGHVYHAIFWFCFYIYSPLVYICNAGCSALRGFVGIHQIHVQSSSTASGFQLVSMFLKLRNVQKVLMTIFFFRTHFTAAWVFLLLRMQNGEKIKDFIIHFHFLTVKVSQMGWISVKISGCDYNKSSVF